MNSMKELLTTKASDKVKKVEETNLTVWAEMNTVNFPLVTMTTQAQKEYSLEYMTKNRNVKWRIVSTPTGRLPGPGALKVLRALEYLFSKKKFSLGLTVDDAALWGNRTIGTTLYELKSMTGLSGQSLVSNLKDLLELQIFHERALYDYVSKQYINSIKALHVIDEINLWKRGREGKFTPREARSAEKLIVGFSEWFIRNHIAKFVKKLGANYFNLSPQAARLYELILFYNEKRKNGSVQIPYQYICQHMPLVQQGTLKEARKKLKHTCTELEQRGHLDSWSVSEISGFWMVIFGFRSYPQKLS